MTGHILTRDQLLIDRYLVEGFHAAGGMQEVYVAFDKALNRKVAVKTPKAGVADRRFKRGAEMSARLNHPNVAATLDYYESDELTFLVEELITGSDLERRLDSDFVAMDPYLAAHVIHHLARALKVAHGAKICHRDLKPSNIMMSLDPGMSSIKLTDFGIAKLAESEIAAEIDLFEKDNSTLTTSNTLLGAVPYMAPECWSDWTSAGQPMDVWALGCISAQLLLGAPPFGTGRRAIANVVRAEQVGVSVPQPVWFGKHAASARLESQLWKIILECLKIAPHERPTASQIVEWCDALCYPVSTRMEGSIIMYGGKYAGGGKGTWGHVGTSEGSKFFHLDDYYGELPPKVGQRVSLSFYPGEPYDRCSPVTALK